MRIEPFALERYFARHEFSARYLLSCSDCEPLSLAALLQMAGPEHRLLWDRLRLAYTESSGHPQLREAIADLYDGVGPDDVLVVVPEEGIFLLMHALLSPGDHAVCVTPAYQSLHEVARSIGAEVSSWRPDENRGWRFDPDRLQELLRAQHEARGGQLSPQPHRRLSGSRRFREDRRHGPPARRHAAVGRDVPVPRGGSRLDPARGVRACPIGRSRSAACRRASVCPACESAGPATRDRNLLDRMAVFKDYTTICAAAPSEILALIALANRETIVARQHERVRRNVAVLDEFIGARPEMFSWHRPRGGSVCLPRWLGREGTGLLADEVVEQAGIMLVPSELFGDGDRHLRVGCGREDLPEVLEHLGDYLSSR